MLARLGSWPNVAVVDLPAADHTVRPIVAQNAVHDLLDAELQRVLDAPLGAPAARVAR
jgi:hypothetical protein